MLFHSTLVLSATLVALAAAPAEAPERPVSLSAIQVVPAVLELGDVAPEAVTRTSVWLVNTSDETVNLVAAKPGCGCITLAGDAPTELAPGRAVELPISVKAPKDVGKAKSSKLAFQFADGGALAAQVHMQTVTAEAASAAPAMTVDDHPLLVAAPGVLRVGDLNPGETRELSLWLVNRSGGSVEVTDAKGGCGCTTLGWKAGVVEANGYVRVPVTVKAPEGEKATPGVRTKRVVVQLAGARPLVVPFAYRVVGA